MGELPFGVGSDAYLAVQELHDSYRRKLEDADRERDELFANPALGDWSVAHKFITNLEPYADLIRNTLSAVESISGNSNVKIASSGASQHSTPARHCRVGVFWCPYSSVRSDEFVPSTASNRNRVGWLSDQPAFCCYSLPH